VSDTKYLGAIRTLSTVRREHESRINDTENLIVVAITQALDDGATWSQIGDAMQWDRATAYRWHKRRTQKAS
jgi:hypothetical protein